MVHPGDSVSDNVWFSRDPALYAQSYGAAVSRESRRTSSMRCSIRPCPAACRRAARRMVSFPNSHLGYAITWFGLALALVGVFVCVRTGQVRAAVVTAPPRQSAGESR